MLWIGEKLNGAVPSIAAAIAEGVLRLSFVCVSRD